MVNNCDAITKAHGITLARILAWSLMVRVICDGLWTTPTRASPSVLTAAPIQDGMIGTCRTFHFVQKDQTCVTITALYKISLSSFMGWNPAVGSTCQGLWAKTYLYLRGLVVMKRRVLLPEK
ncbi:carbohydrate-binding module family 50 protein [Apiospora marii]|uniref:Carbohydrate-binding module family 50 protein n=1 Tax=Apiospora marii TaxID=335849 RepID=A0ABR1RDV6_9PEZI